MQTVECVECGAEQDVVLGEYGTREEHGETVFYQMTIHGPVEIARGDSLAAAMRAAADEIEEG